MEGIGHNLFLFCLTNVFRRKGESMVKRNEAKIRCPAPTTRLRVEKIEGGLMVAGVVIAANCQIILPIFGFLFLLIGCVLTGKRECTKCYRSMFFAKPCFSYSGFIPWSRGR